MRRWTARLCTAPPLCNGRSCWDTNTFKPFRAIITPVTLWCDGQLFITSSANSLGVCVLASIKPSRICHGHHTHSPWHRKKQPYFLRKLNKAGAPKTVQYRYLLYSKEKPQTHPDEKHLKQAWFVQGPRLGSRITCSFCSSNLFHYVTLCYIITIKLVESK